MRIDDSQTYKLLSLYLANTISIQELEELKKLVNISDDQQLSEALSQLWDNYNVEDKYLPNKNNLNSILQNVNRSTRNIFITSVLLKSLRIASAILIPLLLGITIFLYQDRQQLAEVGQKEMIISVPKGQKVNVTLPDGSTVLLNSLSTLRYQQNFGYEDRIVSLQGEGFFDIKKEANKKFIVITEHLDVQVLGTKFNLHAYNEDELIEMALVEGNVRIETHESPQQIAYVKPSEKIIYNKRSKKLTINKSDSKIETAWTFNDIYFRSETFDKVISLLERKYDVNIHLESEILTNDHFTGYINSANIEDALKMLKIHYKFNYKISNNDVWIYSINQQTSN
jgi:transmembrane sensor